MSLDILRLALCQVDVTVGDVAGNAERIADAMRRAAEGGARIAMFPELAICGYPAEDLLLRERFLHDCRDAITTLAAEAPEGLVSVVGWPERDEDVYNAAAVLAGGELVGSYRKCHLPNYGVFDEVRYFQEGPGPATIVVDGHRIGLTICEDIWQPGDPMDGAALSGARLVLNLSASPYDLGKGDRRERMLVTRARDNLAAVAYCGLVGGQDELVFDGRSAVIGHDGTILARAKEFEEDLLFCDVDLEVIGAARLRETRRRRPALALEARVPVLATLTGGKTPKLPAPVAGESLLDSAEGAGDGAVRTVGGGRVTAPLHGPAEAYAALVLGLGDYVRKNGFKHVVIGLSGGIDSTLVALLAVDALGADAVTGVTMPSRYTSDGTLGDAGELARRLGITMHEIPIEGPFKAFEESLAPAFEGKSPDLTEENLQARIRGTLIMALSNKFGWLVLTTANKSETSVGYSTLYGDMAGGFAPLKDTPKMLVFELSAWRSTRDGGELVPPEVLTRPPSAELRPDQQDSDSLPPYEILDAIIVGYVERDLSRDQLIAAGLPAEDVDRALSLIDRAEYKRRQGPPGIRLTSRALSRDRRVPITNRYPPG
ncbi:MAG: NAD+ synthase, partial [Solirubrobacteraceae bacterium]|nr:NAD+ synthase [Solirubrobacteraceae bacterium]